MDFSGVNYLGILVAAVASFFFGSVYYMALAKPWLAAVGKTEEEVRTQGLPAAQMIRSAICQLVMAFVLAGLMVNLGPEQMTAFRGIGTGLLMWFGFVMTTMAVNHGWQGVPKSLTMIDGAHWLGVLVIQGIVLGLVG